MQISIPRYCHHIHVHMNQYTVTSVYWANSAMECIHEHAKLGRVLQWVRIVYLILKNFCGTVVICKHWAWNSSTLMQTMLSYEEQFR